MVTSTDLPDSVKWFANHIESNELPSDGLVLLMDDIAYGESLGNTAKFHEMPWHLSGRTRRQRLPLEKFTGVHHARDL